jgi:aspartyl-tRNA(Asn)/glutamyl-tRNA(Gln) amidotransferase subunit A
MDYSKLDIFEAASLIKEKKLKSEDLLRYHLELAKTRGRDLNAFITIIDDCIEKAKEIDKKVENSEEVGKLAGIPCTIKDVLMTKGVKTTASSQVLKDFVAPYSATVVEKLEAQGAIVIGKTNSDPFAFGASGENSGFGLTKNPIDETRVPGGSSSGAAASLKAGIGMFAIGTDTGGSVRQPASFCGLVGLKVSYGRNSRYGLIAMASSFDTPGVLANSVSEAALIESIIAGKDKKDATTYDIEVPDYLGEIDNLKSLKGLRIGVPDEYFQQGISGQVKESVESTIKKLENAGCEIVRFSMPVLKSGISVYYILQPSEVSSNMARYDGVRFGMQVEDEYLQNLINSRSKYLEPEVKRRIMIGTYALSAGYADEFYKRATRVRVQMIKEVEEIFEDVDVIVGPTSPTTAFKIGEKSEDPLAMYLADVYTVTANIVGCPAISLNCGFDSSGLPIGFQMMSKRFSEDRLFAISAQIEKLLI